MNEIELRKEDTERIINFIKKYNAIHENIGNVEKEMASLNEKTQNLVKSLNSIRESEKDFLSSLENVYGPGRFDSVKMRWIKTK